MTTHTPTAAGEGTAAADELLAHACRVADAVLYEGYVLYPYRASAAKNRMRWQFGVLVPPAWDGHAGEHSAQRTECLAEPRQGARLHVRLRFLRVQRRAVEQVRADGGHEPVEALELPDRVLVGWDEGVEEQAEVSLSVAELVALGEGGAELPVVLPAGEDTEDVRDAAGQVVGRLVRRREPVTARLRVAAAELPGPYRVVRLTATVANTGTWAPAGSGTARDEALPHCLVSAHLMLALTAGSFVSMTDPPQWAAPAVAECRNLHTWPVLAGADGRADAVLSSPIILEDHPHLAPESPGALYDALEIDEILALRTAALTDQEKREARGTDERAGAVIDLADSLPPQVLERLHGAVRSLREVTAGPRPADGPPVLHTPGEDTGALMQPGTPWWDPAADRSVDPERDRVLVDGRSVGAGDRVELRPGLRRTDAQDMFLHGRTALVEAVLHDVDGSVHLAVTVDGDPGAELQRAQGRFRYFQPDEVVPLEAP
ncbi:hypothetical protein [Actinacidiphila guanduensis]|uniref:Uncharacterized protein n=1 Tax=Actinacidiphila guanduensis TaxID=310781 RepID=A0A1H0HJR3_9ACTN|nr:hypothetical protein [Actinacidiphila guanduensis]SDO19428.1 hypothetical protein SAMN05216259_10886 [Actinacidiphila guanduensis]